VLRTLYGLPLADDVRTHRYLLVAADNGGEFAKMAFDVAVAPSAVQRRLSHEFSVLLDVDYQQFLFKVRQPVVQSSDAGIYNTTTTTTTTTNNNNNNNNPGDLYYLGY